MNSQVLELLTSHRRTDRAQALQALRARAGNSISPGEIGRLYDESNSPLSLREWAAEQGFKNSHRLPDFKWASDEQQPDGQTL